MLKVLHNSFSFETVLSTSFKIILSLFEFLFEKIGTTVLQKVLLIAVSFYVRLKFLKPHHQFCYCQQMKIGEASLKNITMLEVTGFVFK